MICPHCHNKIPNGSNICPLCYANLAGIDLSSDDNSPAPEKKTKSTGKSSRKSAYSKGSHSKPNRDRAPMIIAIGFILILVVIIFAIVHSMFTAGSAPSPRATEAPETQVAVQNTPNLVIFGATSTPFINATSTPSLEVTPSPTPEPETSVTTSYKTLRKGDQGPDVISLQKALAELGYLNGAADGIFGTGTMTAVKNFQTANGLAADGIAGSMTQDALYRQATITPIPETTASPDDILDLPG